MIVRSIILKNFRSYNSLNLSFHREFNLLYGNNAQGKTNLLEAVYFLCAFRPFRQSSNDEIITFGERKAGIKGEIESRGSLDEVRINLSNGKKTVRLNGKIMYSLSKYVGRFNVVLFLPTDLKIVKGSPGVRRQYVDAFISNLKLDHIKDLKDYNRSISHRNAILSKSKPINPLTLEVWDDKIAETGGRITKRRIGVIKKLSGELNKVYNTTSGVNSMVGIKYKTSFKINGSIPDSIRKALRENFDKDRLRGHTTLGPHRDLITFTIDENDASSFASQGESKNLVLALKASEINLFEEVKGQKPVLLLDDITSELDRNRKNFLFNLLRNYAGQVFVTSTGVDEIPYSGDKKVFRIIKGRAEVDT